MNLRRQSTRTLSGSRIGVTGGTEEARVLCPTTNPLVKHHAALRSLARVYLTEKGDLDRAWAYCRTFPRVEMALGNSEAAGRFELPPG